jgi:hypothetical protein
VEWTLGGIEIMSGQKKTFLLPCGACGHEIEVVAGQAGGQVECPSCGRRNDVPKFRDLAQLRLKADVVAVPTRWGLPQAVALAGVAWAALSWGTAAWVGLAPKPVIDVNRIHAVIDAGNDTALYQSLQELASATVDRPPFLDEVALQRQSLFARGMSRTLYAIGGLGALAAAVAGLAAFSRAKRA